MATRESEKVDCPVHGTLRSEIEPGNAETNGPGNEPAGDVAPFSPAGGEAM